MGLLSEEMNGKKTVITREGFFQIQELKKNLLNSQRPVYYVTYLRLGRFCCLFLFSIAFLCAFKLDCKVGVRIELFCIQAQCKKIINVFAYIFCTIITLWTLFKAADPLNIAFQIDLAQKLFFSEGAYSDKQMQTRKKRANLSCDSDP
jgi:hypothetical protein